MIRLDAGELGAVAVVMVGASGVGHIDLTHLGPSSTDGTSAWRRAHERRHTSLDVPIARGDELGAFRLGSTVVLVFEPGAVEPPTMVAGAPLRFGQRLLRIAAGRRA